MKPNILKIVIAALLLTSCTRYAYLNIDVLEPAELTVPAGVDTTVFLVSAPGPLMDDKLLVQYKDKELESLKKALFILDTIAINKIREGLQAILALSPKYTQDTLLKLDLRNTEGWTIKEPLSPEQISILMEELRTDMLISLDDYAVSDSFFTYMDYESYRIAAVMQMRTMTRWHLYLPGMDTAFAKIQQYDTIVWDGYGTTESLAYNYLPEEIDAMREAFYSAGERVGMVIAPVWYEVERFYFTGPGRSLRKAGMLAKQGKWTEAGEIWKKMAYEERPSRAAKACYNMALLCETRDLLLPAIDWAIKSNKLDPKPYAREYIKVLGQRYKNYLKLKEQMFVE